MSDIPLLKLMTLGQVRIDLGDKQLTDLGTRKAELLLVYLAYARRPVEREQLASLFWEAYPVDNARASLSVALSQLRKQLPQHMVATRNTVSINTELPLWIDAEELEQAWLSWQKRGNRGEPPAVAMTRLEAAVALYNGDFLDAAFVDAGTRFEEWVLLERERLRRLAMTAEEALATRHLNGGEYEAASAYARHMLVLDPLHEAAHRLVMEALARQGRRGAALEQFASCRELLRRELDVEPEPSTKALAERIRDEVPQVQLPARPAFFAGRAQEKADVRRHLLSSDCRLLTLIGPGGAGKTSLALELAWSLRSAFLSGVSFVDLSGTESTTSFVSSIATVLGCDLQSGESATEQLLDYLREKEVLLVLDNLEQLLPATALLDQLLSRAPRLKILATSRQRLDLRQEWLYELHGLAYPAMVPPGNGTASGSAEAAREYGAVELFVHQARKLGVDPDGNREEMAAVLRICQLVGGLPLGILLAAAWARFLSFGEIAQELEAGVAFLAAPWTNLPERHRSLSALFAHSLERLSSVEREAYRQLAVFPRTFERQAAQKIAGASLTVLSSLVDRSLVRPCPYNGSRRPSQRRFELPDPLHQYARHLLSQAPEEEAAARDRHATYYAAFLVERQEKFRGPDQRQVFAEIGAEIANIRYAWSWAVERGRIQWLGQSADSLGFYFRRAGLYEEGEAAYHAAASALQDIPQATARALRARLLVWQNVFSRMLGRVDAAEGLLAESEQLLQDLAVKGGDVRSSRAFLLFQMGKIKALSDLAEARRLFQQSLTLHEALDDRWGIGRVRQELGTLEHGLGRKVAAFEHYASGLRELEAVGDTRGMAYLLGRWAKSATLFGELSQAETLARRAHSLYQRLDERSALAEAMQQLGAILVCRGKYAEATLLLREGLAVFQDLGHLRAVPRVRTALATALANQGEDEEAYRLGHSALELARKVPDYPVMARAQLVLGWIAIARQEYEEAAARLRRSADTFGRLGERAELGYALAALGCAEVHAEQMDDAQVHLVGALEIACENRDPFAALAGISGMALLFARQDRGERALELLSLVSSHPMASNSQLTRDSIARPVALATAGLPQEERDAAWARGRSRELWEVAASLLEAEQLVFCAPALVTESGRVAAD